MARQPNPKPDLETAAIAATMRLAAARRWSQVGLADIAAEAGLDLAQLYRVARSKGAILRLLARQADGAALAGKAEPGEPARDRLLDVLMRRFEALKPYRTGLRGLARSCAPEGVLLLLGLRRSLAWMLEAAGVSSSGLPGLVRTKLLGIAYLAAFRAFLADEGEDLAATMAALDRALTRVEPFLRLPVPDAAEPEAAPV